MLDGFHSKFKSIRYKIVTQLSVRPTLYYGLRHITGTYDDLCVRSDTELVIEGYPRSANSTTVANFLSRQARTVRIAHHKHHAAQLLVAAKRGLPAVMLIRQPEHAILSNLALIREVNLRGGYKKKMDLTFCDALFGWINFYQALEHSIENFVIAPFEVVTRDISGMIQSLNAKYGTDYVHLPLSTGYLSDRALGYHAMPNELRNSIKCELSKEFSLTLLESDILSKMLRNANDLYHHIMNVYECHS